MLNRALKSFFFVQVALEHAAGHLFAKSDDLLAQYVRHPFQQVLSKLIVDNNEISALRADVESIRGELHSLRTDLRELQTTTV